MTKKDKKKIDFSKFDLNLNKKPKNKPYNEKGKDEFDSSKFIGRRTSAMLTGNTQNLKAYNQKSEEENDQTYQAIERSLGRRTFDMFTGNISNLKGNTSKNKSYNKEDNY